MKLRDTTGLLLGAFALATVGATVGCGDGRPERVPVSGTVLIDGQPVTKGSVMFVHADSRPSGGLLDASGRFVLSCYEEGDGAVVGKHHVKVIACEPLTERSNRWHAPKKYAETDTSGIEIEITEPVENLPINLTWSGGKPFVERW